MSGEGLDYTCYIFSYFMSPSDIVYKQKQKAWKLPLNLENNKLINFLINMSLLFNKTVENITI